MDKIEISIDEYKELVAKAEAYDKIRANNSAAGKKSANNMTAEELTARAKKAVQARIEKYGQKSKK